MAMPLWVSQLLAGMMLCTLLHWSRAHTLVSDNVPHEEKGCARSSPGCRGLLQGHVPPVAQLMVLCATLYFLEYDYKS